MIRSYLSQWLAVGQVRSHVRAARCSRTLARRLLIRAPRTPNGSHEVSTDPLIFLLPVSVLPSDAAAAGDLGSSAEAVGKNLVQ